MTPIEFTHENRHYLLNGDLLSQEDCVLFEQASATATQHNQLGRGTVYFFGYKNLHLVLRHYRRGGLMRHFCRSHYFNVSVRTSRMWREFAVMSRLNAQGLPVPAPIAALCVKTSPFTYRGTLVTQVISDSQTLAEYLENSHLDKEKWRQLGETLARFHAAGADHADLNANNILIDDQNRFYVIDFDKGVLRHSAGTWQVQNIARLLRSLHKLKRLKPSPFYFDQSDWDAMLRGYQQSAAWRDC